MSAERLNDQKVLGWLLGAGRITAAQARRLEAELDRGTPLDVAICRVPIADPYDLDDARGLLGIEAAPVASPVPAPARPSAVVPGLRRDDDGVAVLDLAEDDAEFPEPVRPDGRPSSAAVPVRRPAEDPAPLLDSETLPAEALDLSAATQAGELPPAAFDLDQDDGIPLLVHLHGLIRQAIMADMAAVQLAFTRQQGAWAEYDHLGARQNVLPLEGTTGEKMAARLKVMARLSPWLRAGKLATMAVTRKKIAFRLLVQLDETNGVQRLTMVFAGQFPVG
ncbi:MAG: hypothetical protein KF858_16100 [Candidatus Sumerlaeia bacterium]|nr:hypothetical protein [Candidatus Sumerlaeia bacterium]